MELGHNGDGLLGANSIIVVYMDPLGRRSSSFRRVRVEDESAISDRPECDDAPRGADVPRGCDTCRPVEGMLGSSIRSTSVLAPSLNQPRFESCLSAKLEATKLPFSIRCASGFSDVCVPEGDCNPKPSTHKPSLLKGDTPMIRWSDGEDTWQLLASQQVLISPSSEPLL